MSNSDDPVPVKITVSHTDANLTLTREVAIETIELVIAVNEALGIRVPQETRDTLAELKAAQ